MKRHVYAVSLVVALAAAALLLVMHLQLYEYAYDDAYIHFRIIENLADFGVPYFNPAQPVKASSSTGWNIVLYPLLQIGRRLGNTELPLLVAALNAIITFAGAVVYTTLLLSSSTSARRYLVGTLFFVAYLALTLRSSIGLMEVSCSLLMLGIAFRLLLSGSRYSFAFFGASVFFRLELVVIVGVVVLHQITKKRFPLKNIFFLSIFGMLPFILYDLLYFGTIMPNTIKAKSTVYSVTTAEVLVDIAKGLLPSLSLPLFEYQPAYAILYIGSLLVVISGILAVQTVKGIAYGRDRGEYELCSLFAIWGIAVSGIYLITKAHIFPWYTPLYALPFVFVLSRILLNSQSRLSALGLTVLVIPLVASMLASVTQTARGAFVSPAYYQGFEEGARVRHYLELGENLQMQYPEVTLMTSEIGGLGYSFRGTIVDGAGLVSPEALAYHPMSIPEERSHGKLGAIPVGFIEDTNPEVIVSYDVFVEAFLKSNVKNHYVRTTYPVFLEDDLMHTEQRIMWNSQYLNVFIRRELAHDVVAP